MALEGLNRRTAAQIAEGQALLEGLERQNELKAEVDTNPRPARRIIGPPGSESRRDTR